MEARVARATERKRSRQDMGAGSRFEFRPEQGRLAAARAFRRSERLFQIAKSNAENTTTRIPLLDPAAKPPVPAATAVQPSLSITVAATSGTIWERENAVTCCMGWSA
jgi:hypothetical protein